MKHLKISKYSPRLRSIYYTAFNQSILDSNIVILVNGKPKYAQKVIPVQPSTHIETLLKIHKDAFDKKIAILPVVTSYFIGKMGQQKSNTVTIPYNEMVEDLQVSRPTLSDALNYLRDNDYIVKVGQSSYRIAPILAFYGHVDTWAIAIEAYKSNLSEDETGNLLDQLSQEKSNLHSILNNFQSYIDDEVKKLNPLN